MPQQFDADTFTYANGNLATVSSGKWTMDTWFSTDLVVSGNAITGVAASGSRSDVITSWAGSTTDQWADLKIASGSGSGSPGPVVRSNGAGTYYFVTCNIGGTPTLQRATGNSAFALAGGTHVVAVGDVLRLEAQGTTLRVFVNGVLDITFTDTNIASGKPGVYGTIATIFGDNWAAGDFSTPPPPIKLVPNADVSTGTWTSSGANLNSVLDEAVTDDADFIQSAATPVNDVAEVALTDPATTSAGTTTIVVRARK
jgi:hypothetical protein